MAGIGLSKPYYAIYNWSGSGMPTYSGGGKLGKATQMELTLDEGDSNVLNADNGPAETDNQFSGGSLSISTDDLLPPPMLAALGLKAEAIQAEGLTTQNPQWIVYDDDQTVPYVGFGGIIKKQINNVTKWVALVLLKVQYSNPGVTAVTQGDTIEWQTSTLTATVLRSDEPKHRWQMMSYPLDTEADAEAAIRSILGISDDPTLGTLTVTSAAGSTTGTTAITVTPAITYGNHYVYQTGDTVTLPEAGADVSTGGWLPWDGTAQITATNGNEIAIVEANADNQAVSAGKTTVTANAGA